MEKIYNWVKKNRWEAFWLSATLLSAAFLRLYKIDEYMTFLGDEGRDVIIVRRLLVNFDPILIGPGTSIGNMYLGPLYYYLMAPFLFLANFSPVGPAVMIALLGLTTVFMTWYIAREWFGKLGALVAASLYAVSPVVITYSHSSWNPNIMPFFSLLCIYSIWRTYNDKQFKWLIVVGTSYAFVLQSHYLGLLLAPILGIYWFLTYIKIHDPKVESHKSQLREFFKYSLIGLIVFAFLMSPLVIFDARHEWRNFSAMKLFFTERQTTVSARPWSSIPKLWPLLEKISTRLVSGYDEKSGRIVSLILLLGTVILLITKFRKGKLLIPKHYILLFFWLGIALIGLGVYKQEIYDHYYGFFFPAPFLLLGGLSQSFRDWSGKKNFLINFISLFLIIIFILFLVSLNLKNSPLKNPPNRQLQRTEEVSQKIVEESGGHDFNLAVIAERNYEGAYEYFLEKWNSPIVMIDPQKTKETIKDQLFVVCELPADKCDPTHDPKAGIANFGWSKIDGEWQVEGVTLYKLVHSR